jgi:hypothetical protein
MNASHYVNIYLILRVYSLMVTSHVLGQVQGWGNLDHSIATTSIILRIWSLPSVVNSP